MRRIGLIHAKCIPRPLGLFVACMLMSTFDACVRQQRAGSSHTPVLMRVGQSSHAGARSTVSVLTARVSLVSDLRAMRLLNPQREASEPARVLIGNIRAELSADNAVSFADDRSAQTLEAGTLAAGDEWLFVADDGVVLKSASFLGPLRRLSETNATRRRVIAGDGVLYLGGPSRPHWLVTAGSAGRVWPDFPTVSGAFASATRGAVIDPVGNVWLTQDAGAHTRPLSPTVEGADTVDVVRIDGATELRLHSANGLQIISQTGQVEYYSQPIERALTARQRRLLLEAAITRWPSALWRLAVSGQRNLETPLIVVDQDVLQVNASTGRVLQTYVGAVPGGECTASAWGPNVLFVCSPSSLPYLWRPGGITRQLTDGSSTRIASLSDDGLHAINYGPCSLNGQAIWTRPPRGSRSGRPPPNRLNERCVTRDAGATWQTVTLPENLRTIGELQGAKALVYGQFEIGIFDLDTGQVAPLGWTPVPSQSVTIRRAGFAVDKTVWAFLSSGSNTPSFFAHWAGPHETAVPTEAASDRMPTAMLDAHRGIGTSLDPDTSMTTHGLWSTVDQSAHWTQIPAPIQGAPRSVVREGDRTHPRCSAARCVQSDRLVIDFVDAGVSAQPVLLGSTLPRVAAPTLRLLPSSRGQEYAMVELPLTCHSIRSVPLRQSRARSDVSATVTLTDTQDTPNTRRLSATWTLDESPSVRVNAGSGSVAMPSTNGWSTLHATPHWLYIEACREPGQTRCSHVILADSAPPTRLLVASNQDEVDDQPLVNSMQLSTDRHALLFRGYRSGTTWRQRLILLDDRGAVIATRLLTSVSDGSLTTVFEQPITPPDTLVTHRDELGVLRTTLSDDRQQGPRVFYYPLVNLQGVIQRAPEDLTDLFAHFRELPADCPLTQQPGSYSFSGLRVGVSVVFEHAHQRMPARSGAAQIELTSEGRWCVRSVTSGSYASDPFDNLLNPLPEVVSLRVAASAGTQRTTLGGSIEHRGRRHSVRCAR